MKSIGTAVTVLWAAALLAACGFCWRRLRYNASACEMTYSWPSYTAMEMVWVKADVYPSKRLLHAQSAPFAANMSVNASSEAAVSSDEPLAATGLEAEADHSAAADIGYTTHRSALAHKYTLWQWTSSNPGHRELYTGRPTSSAAQGGKSAGKGRVAGGSVGAGVGPQAPNGHVGVVPGSLPVLFIPGHAGSYRQSRSVAGAVAELAEHALSRAKAEGTPTAAGVPFVEVFALHFAEETSALLGHAAADQCTAVVDAILTLQSLYNHTAVPVFLVAHSMGGLAARAAVLDARLPAGSIAGILCLACPVAGPPLTSDALLTRLYAKVNAAWRGAGLAASKQRGAHGGGAPVNSSSIPVALRPAYTPLVLVSTGEGDSQVTPTATMTLQALTPTASARTEGLPWQGLSTADMPGVGTSVHHVACTWCGQIVRPVAAALLKLAAENSKAGGVGSSDTPEEAAMGDVSSRAEHVADLFTAELLSPVYAVEGARGRTFAGVAGAGVGAGTGEEEDGPQVGGSRGAQGRMVAWARTVSTALLGTDLLGAPLYPVSALDVSSTPSMGGQGQWQGGPGGAGLGHTQSVVGWLGMLPLYALPSVITLSAVLAGWAVAHILLTHGLGMPPRGVADTDSVTGPRPSREMSLAQLVSPLALHELDYLTVATAVDSVRVFGRVAVAWAVHSFNIATGEPMPALPYCLGADADRFLRPSKRHTPSPQAQGGAQAGQAAVPASVAAAAVCVYLAGCVYARPGSWGSPATHTPLLPLLLFTYPASLLLLLLLDTLAHGAGWAGSKACACCPSLLSRGWLAWVGSKTGLAALCGVWVTLLSLLLGTVRVVLFLAMYGLQSLPDAEGQLPSTLPVGLGKGKKLLPTSSSSWVAAAVLSLYLLSLLLLPLLSIRSQSLATPSSRLLLRLLGVCIPVLGGCARVGEWSHLLAILVEGEGRPGRGAFTHATLGLPTDAVVLLHATLAAVLTVGLQLSAWRVASVVSQGKLRAWCASTTAAAPLPPTPGTSAAAAAPLPTPAAEAVSHASCSTCVHELGGAGALYNEHDSDQPSLQAPSRGEPTQTVRVLAYGRAEVCGAAAQGGRGSGQAASKDKDRGDRGDRAQGQGNGKGKGGSKGGKGKAMPSAEEAPSTAAPAAPASRSSGSEPLVPVIWAGPTFTVATCDCWQRLAKEVAGGRLKMAGNTAHGQGAAAVARRLEDVPVAALRARLCDFCACTCAGCGGEALARKLMPKPIAAEDGDQVEDVPSTASPPSLQAQLALHALLCGVLAACCGVTGWLLLFAAGTQSAHLLPLWALAVGTVATVSGLAM